MLEVKPTQEMSQNVNDLNGRLTVVHKILQLHCWGGDKQKKKSDLES